MFTSRLFIRAIRLRILDHNRIIYKQFSILPKTGQIHRCNNLERYRLLCIPKCSFYTTPKRNNPIISIITRQVIKVVTIFTGRAIRKWYTNLPGNKKKRLIAWLVKHKWKFITPIFLMILSMIVYYQTHIEETPITKRKRFIAFTFEEFKSLNEIELESQLQTFKDKLLPATHPTTKEVAGVAKKLLEANKDFKEIENLKHDWTVSVIDDSDTVNAFVLPSGNIFVFTGLLKICENNDQLGIVLSHEISHAILGHGIEVISHAHIVDMIFIGLIAFIWMFLPTDTIAAIGTAISRFMLRIMLETPYSKMLETEADEVGLYLAAKACFDVRESSAFWTKMSNIEKQNTLDTIGTDIPIDIDFLKSHPSHEQRCENLDRLIEKALKCRAENGCPSLPKADPRDRVKKIVSSRLSKKEDNGLLRLENIGTSL